VLVGGVGLLRDRSAGSTPTCEGEDDAGCHAPVAPASPTVKAPPVLDAATACRNVGYLCAELVMRENMRLRRWKDFSGTLVVYVPRPDFEDSEDAARLQEAAMRGLRAWNGQPFQILADRSGEREAHFAVRWTRTLGGNRIGVAHTEWSSATGLNVLSIELATRSPFDRGRVNDPRRVQLTAAHEMGHALGLPHSDSERDVMYPTNTATSMSAQDYRTMEVLYGLEDGTEIVR
jgi:hypothetical protein